jgi:hypothetical protein
MNAAFFQPDHTYVREHHAATIRFLVKHVDDSPCGTYRVAFGWSVEDGDVTWAPFDSDDLTGWVDATEETSSPAAPDDSTVARRTHLARAIRQGGRWKSGTVTDWYAANGYTGCDVQTARGDLTALRQADVIVQHDEPGVRYYTAARHGGDRRG